MKTAFFSHCFSLFSLLSLSLSLSLPSKASSTSAVHSHSTLRFNVEMVYSIETWVTLIHASPLLSRALLSSPYQYPPHVPASEEHRSFYIYQALCTCTSININELISDRLKEKAACRVIQPWRWRRRAWHHHHITSYQQLRDKALQGRTSARKEEKRIRWTHIIQDRRSVSSRPSRFYTIIPLNHRLFKK